MLVAEVSKDVCSLKSRIRYVSSEFAYYSNRFLKTIREHAENLIIFISAFLTSKVFNDAELSSRTTCERAMLTLYHKCSLMPSYLLEQYVRERC